MTTESADPLLSKLRDARLAVDKILGELRGKEPAS
jgi:hypothetical protein